MTTAGAKLWGFLDTGGRFALGALSRGRIALELEPQW